MQVYMCKLCTAQDYERMHVYMSEFPALLRPVHPDVFQEDCILARLREAMFRVCIAALQWYLQPCGSI